MQRLDNNVEKVLGAPSGAVLKVAMKDLQALREEIDHLDEQLWEIVGKRADVVRRVGEWKRQHGEQVIQPERWQQVLQHCQAIAEQHGLSEELVHEVMEAIHKESVRIES